MEFIYIDGPSFSGKTTSLKKLDAVCFNDFSNLKNFISNCKNLNIDPNIQKQYEQAYFKRLLCFEINNKNKNVVFVDRMPYSNRLYNIIYKLFFKKIKLDHVENCIREEFRNVDIKNNIIFFLPPLSERRNAKNRTFEMDGRPMNYLWDNSFLLAEDVVFFKFAMMYNIQTYYYMSSSEILNSIKV